MKRKISKFLSLLLAAILLLSLIAPAALAAESSDTVYLRTAEDLAELSRNCTLDSWSQGKTAYLEADIDLTGADFVPIPTFGGTLEGQGHTISGLSITSGDHHQLHVFRGGERGGQHRRDRGHQRGPGTDHQLFLLRLCHWGALCGRHRRAELRLHRSV